MQSLNNQRLESSLSKTNAYPNNGREKRTTGSYRVLRDEIAASADTLDYSVNEPAFLNGDTIPSLLPAKVGERVETTAPYTQESKGLPPRRTVALQVRFIRTLWFAARLF